MKTAPFYGFKVGTGLILTFFLLVRAAAQPTGTPAAVAGTTEPNSSALTAVPLPLPAFAALGSAFAQSNSLAKLGWSEEQKAAFLDGVNAELHGKGYAMDDAARQVSAEMARRIQQLEEHRKQEAVESFAQPSRLAQYMKDMRKRFSLQMSDSGLAYSIQPGRPGVRPRPGDTVVVSCQATAADGTTKLPQLSNDHIRLKMTNLMPGFMEALQMMTVDSQARLILPPALSFGDNEWPQGVDRGTPLLFFLTLHDVISAETAP